VRNRGFTLVEVLVAAAILMLCAGLLLEALAYSRIHSAVNRHRERALALAADTMESTLRQGYPNLPVGTSVIVRPLEDDGSLPCTLTRTITQDTTWPDVQGLRRVSVRGAWTEPRRSGSPTHQVELHSLVGDPVP